jgi:hypothetical protein
LNYFGAVLIVSELTWLTTDVYEHHHAKGMFGLGGVFIVFFTYFAHIFWQKNMRIPAGLLYLLGVISVPLLMLYPVELFQQWLTSIGVSGFKTAWMLEILTVIVGVIYFYYRRCSILLLPIIVSSSLLLIDVSDSVLHSKRILSFYPSQLVSFVFGSFLNGIAFYWDKRTKEDFSWWAYFIGGNLAWFALYTRCLDFLWYPSAKGEVFILSFLLFSIFYFFGGFLLNRKLFIILGALGTFHTAWYFANKLFKDALFSPFMLVGVGLLIITLGLLCQKHHVRMRKALHQILPDFIKRKLPEYRLENTKHD